MNHRRITHLIALPATAFVLAGVTAATPIAIVAYILTRPRDIAGRGTFWFDTVVLVLEAGLFVWIFLPMLTRPNPHEHGEVLIPFVITIISVPFLTLAALLRWVIFRHTRTSKEHL